MSLPNTSRRIAARMVLAAATVLVTGATLLAAQTPAPGASAGQPAGQPAPVVAVTALTPLVPAPAGWTKLREASNHVELAPGVDYAYADAVFLKEDLRVRLTVADTGGHQESLMAFASVIMSFPDNYVGKVEPATTITRAKFNEWPAAELWDPEKCKGEVTVLVAGRFVAKAEGNADTLETLKALVGQIDLKKLAALK